MVLGNSFLVYASLINKLLFKKEKQKNPQPSTSLCCLFRLGLYREAEKQFKSALKQQDMVDTILYLAKVSHLLISGWIEIPTYLGEVHTLEKLSIELDNTIEFIVSDLHIDVR